MDFARETRGHTARAACGHTSSGGQGVDNAFVSFPNYWKHLFEDTLLCGAVTSQLTHRRLAGNFIQST